MDVNGEMRIASSESLVVCIPCCKEERNSIYFMLFVYFLSSV